LPTRLFKLDRAAVRSATNKTDLAKVPLGHIVEGKSLKSCNYCTVTHVWGNKPPSFPIANVPWMVPVSSIDKFLFVLKTCDIRGYEYVWLDLLCIDQTRDSPDQQIEMPKMHGYYKNAHATIAFGADWAKFASLWATVDSLVKGWNGDVDKAITADWDGLGAIDAFISDGWFWRVWTLQETVIPLTTTPLDTVVTNPAPYTCARLLTSDGTPIDVRGLCDLIGWTYIALAKLPFTSVTGKYSWIHPGAGIVNDHGSWWQVTILNEAVQLGAGPLHPIQAMLLTRYRETKYPMDRLNGVYALLDAKWHISATEPKDAYKKLADKYIAEKEGALLVSMGVNQQTRTWAAATDPDSEFASFVAPGGDYTLISATVTGDTLSLKAAGLIQVTVKGTKAYGDGSGELTIRLIPDVAQFDAAGVDISSIVALVVLAATSRIESPLNSLQLIQSFTGASTSNANSLSSALRAAFSGWNRWIITFPVPGGKTKAVLAWLPFHNTTAAYSLLWLKNGVNKWAVIVQGDAQNGYKKVGIAFVDSAPMGATTDVTLL